MHILHKPSVSTHLYNYTAPIENGICAQSVFELTIGLVLGGTSCSPVDYNKKIFLVYQKTCSLPIMERSHTLKIVSYFLNFFLKLHIQNRKKRNHINTSKNYDVSALTPFF